MVAEPSFLRQLFTGVWLARFGLNVFAAGLTAYIVSFAVADYVVRANTSSTQTTLSTLADGMGTSMGALRGSIDQLNASMLSTVDELEEISDKLGSLETQTSTQVVEIGYIRRDLARVQLAVQDFGIQIPAVGQIQGGYVINTARLSEIQAALGVGDEAPVFLTLNPDVSILKPEIIQEGDQQN